ncbi:TPM domain-containing protein [Anaerobacillus sp. MEB173]|uniref:TPM domain-containing protein n=1 Tax=Anaerobacillus sp. MEB173 TaxID=3383345 RepID=UPI003F90B713
MRRKLSASMLLIFLMFSFIQSQIVASTEQKVYDFAELLTAQQRDEVERLADLYSEQSEVDIIILTTAQTDGRDIEKYMQDFYDEMGLGYNQPFGDTVILTIDMENREVYVAGFYKGMEYIDNDRAHVIRESITPYLSNGDFFSAITTYIELTNEYMGIEPEVHEDNQIPISPGNDQIYVQPGVKSENLFYQLWFQIFVSIFVGGVSVGVMAYRSTGRKTTTARTYLDDSNSAVTSSRDTFVRTTVTKRKKPSSNNNNSGGGGFGGGMTGGGHSHSGSRGRF